jgi:UDP-3-O-[3-hydroxymyristoyl] N-acetylglucosamine deacetylase
MWTEQVSLPHPAQTLASPLHVEGVGLHSGARARLTLSPHDAPGWWARGADGQAVPLAAAQVVHTAHATTLALPCGERWATLEHALGAISGLWLDAVCVSLTSDAPSEQPREAPILDGSAWPWVEAILSAGLRPVPWPRAALRLRAPWSLTLGDGPRAPRLSLAPCDRRVARYVIAYDEPLPEGAGEAAWDEALDPFTEAVARARTFAFKPWLEALQARGLIRGGSLDCAVVFDAGRPVNPEGLRFVNEPARHKVLDLLGDLALLGAPLLARAEVSFGGHDLHAQAVAALRSLR